MVMVTLEDRMLLPQEIFMTDKLMIIAIYAVPAGTAYMAMIISLSVINIS